jgi:hypothetical protein
MGGSPDNRIRCLASRDRHATPARSGPFARPADLIPYPYTDVASFVPGDCWWLYPGFLLALAFVGLMGCIHYYAP